MQRLCSIFLYAFLADGLLSFADELTGGHAAGGLLSMVRSLLALGVLFLAVIVYAGMVLSPRLARRVLLLPALFTIWADILEAFPLSYYDVSAGWIAFAQVALGACVLGAYGRRVSDAWTIPCVVESRPLFTWGNFGTGFLFSILLGVVCCMSAVATVCSGLEKQTAGYLKIRPAGIYLEEKRFRKGDQEVRLVGMMHIARHDFYDRLAADLRDTAPAVVLMEGITDHKEVLKGKFSYGRLAGLLGISSQETSSYSRQAIRGLKDESAPQPGATPPPVEYRMADLDISAFQPQTIAFIEAVGALMDSSNMDEAMARLRDPRSPLRDNTSLPVIQADIFQKRNEHLIDAMQKALTDHNTVVLPWGAEHMPAMQKQLEEWGFHEEKSIVHPAITFLKPAAPKVQGN